MTDQTRFDAGAASPVPLFVINLDRAAQRLAFLNARLDALNLSAIRIAAVDGAAIAEDERQAFAAARPRDGKRGWRPGQIGCFMSHRTVWRRIAEGDSAWGLVLEDDLHLSDALPALLAAIDWIPDDADIVRLESTGQWLKLGPVAAKARGRAVRPIRSAAWGAGAYLLSRVAAARLCASDPAVQSPVDDFLFNPATSSVARALSVYQLVPAIASQDKFSDDAVGIQGFGSDIETDRMVGRLSRLSGLRRAVTSTLRGKSPVPVR